MRKQTICIGENKAADQLRGDREADQRFCFRYMTEQFLFFLYPKFSSFCFCACTSRFVSDLAGNTNCWFSHAQAQICFIAVAAEWVG